MKRLWTLLLLFPLLTSSSWIGNRIILTDNEQQSIDCEKLGWFPDGFGLKDHSVFIYDGYYYLVSIYYPGENYFAYARSEDLCNWEDLSPILTERNSEWDNQAIWSPHVIEDSGVYYLFYTGVKGPYPNLTQSIMLATTTDPSDPSSWNLDGMVFQPEHPGMLWKDNAWSNCRDPHVFKLGDLYYLIYTGSDSDGGIVGMATASTPYGSSWSDFGSIMTLDGPGIPESPVIWQEDGGFYLFYSRSGGWELSGEKYRFGPTPAGPWSDEFLFSPGWAHEVWSGLDGKTYTSYLTDYTVTIQPLLWNYRYNPPKPFIGEQIVEIFLPLMMR